MTFRQAIVSGFSNYVNFSGRTGRSEFWFWMLFATIVGVIAETLDLKIFGYHPGPFLLIWNAFSVLPNFTVMVRRLHDIDRTGWWILLLLSVIGTVVLIYWFCFKGTPGPNRFGPDPLGALTPASTQPATWS
jgi:uncharacterized membrane protein YhaH (DUF805 family)